MICRRSTKHLYNSSPPARACFERCRKPHQPRHVDYSTVVLVYLMALFAICCFVAQIAVNKKHHAQSMAALFRIPGMDKGSTETIAKEREDVELDPEPRNPDTGRPERKNKRRVVLSKRHEQLACPRKPPDGAR